MGSQEGIGFSMKSILLRKFNQFLRCRESALIINLHMDCPAGPLWSPVKSLFNSRCNNLRRSHIAHSKMKACVSYIYLPANEKDHLQRVQRCNLPAGPSADLAIPYSTV